MADSLCTKYLLNLLCLSYGDMDQVSTSEYYWSRPVLEGISRLMVIFESFCTKTAMVLSFRQFRIPVQLAVNLDFCCVSTAILRNHDCAAKLYLGRQGRPAHDSKSPCRPLASRLPILGQFEGARSQFCQLL